MGYDDNGQIMNCYSSCDVTGTYYVGGFCGSVGFGTSISYCYSTGSVAFSPGCDNTCYLLGGFCGGGYNNNFTCCFWGFEGADPGLTDTGSEDVPNIEELNVADFANQSSFSCFDFNGTWMMAGGHPVLTELTVPTLTEWAIIAFIGLLAGVGGWFLWRKML